MQHKLWREQNPTPSKTLQQNINDKRKFKEIKIQSISNPRLNQAT
jgi:hypothetical protein